MGKKAKSSSPRPGKGRRRVYELEVCIIGGPMMEDFAKANPVISRTIQVRGDQKLLDLHEAIFKAFNRFDNHFFEFQVGGKGPHDPKARKYILPQAAEGPFGDDNAAGLVHKTTLDALELTEGDAFGYWFDFGDDWWHQINVLAVREAAAGQKYPKVVAKVGNSPPQYPDWDDEDDEEEDE